MTYKILIPTPGTEIKLAQDWQFELFFERKNLDLFLMLEALKLLKEENFKPSNTEIKSYFWAGVKYASLIKYYDQFFAFGTPPAPFGEWVQGVPFSYRLTLPANSEIIFDRFYIHKSHEAVSKIVFRTKKLPFKKFNRKPRFWAKLDDVNQLIVD
jgi:hypothetical protein